MVSCWVCRGLCSDTGAGGVSGDGSPGHFSRLLLVPDRQMQVARWLSLCGLLFAVLPRAGGHTGPEDLGDTSRYGALGELAWGHVPRGQGLWEQLTPLWYRCRWPCWLRGYCPSRLCFSGQAPSRLPARPRRAAPLPRPPAGFLFPVRAELGCTGTRRAAGEPMLWARCCALLCSTTAREENPEDAVLG